MIVEEQYEVVIKEWYEVIIEKRYQANIQDDEWKWLRRMTTCCMMPCK